LKANNTNGESLSSHKLFQSLETVRSIEENIFSFKKKKRERRKYLSFLRHSVTFTGARLNFKNCFVVVFWVNRSLSL